MFFQYILEVWKSLTRRRVRVFIEEKEYELLDAKSGNFSVITYNIAGLPQVISSAKTDRSSSIAHIGSLVNDFDVAHIQEDFNYNYYLYQSGNLHPYRTISMGLAIFGDGLDSLSKYPITNFKRVEWQNRTGSDRLTPKGFSHCTMHLALGVAVDFYNIHANSQDHPRAAKARRANYLQLANYINKHSVGKAIIVAGDFNSHFAFSEDNLEEFMVKTHLQDSWIMLERDDVMPTIDPLFLCMDIMDIDNESESIDKIMFRSNEQITLMPKKYEVEREKFVDKLGEPLSDHWPVSVVFDWMINE
ncbi:endonuclease [Sphingobacterium sp. PCS056]|jgi:exonuclease III|uniref:endonuclease/exonuclease/phosphatase family protein n=1 Tax=Sphingobacterium sp. PCS056 TaxID=2931400 RepID=UPI00200D1312|nr:endonuclease [Sphingobacterium sp. PCS056]UPZ36246.1 endonuclease [Sphingobacterium sp. PCS056]